MPIVVFDPTEFRQRRPQLESLSDAQLLAAFDTACLILDNSERSPVPYAPDAGVLDRKTLLDLLVCHLATLALRGGGAVGALSSATEGSVSASFQAPTVAGADWFCQTPCGFADWQAVAGYRFGGRWYAGSFR